MTSEEIEDLYSREPDAVKAWKLAQIVLEGLGPVTAFEEVIRALDSDRACEALEFIITQWDLLPADDAGEDILEGLEE